MNWMRVSTSNGTKAIWVRPETEVWAFWEDKWWSWGGTRWINRTRKKLANVDVGDATMEPDGKGHGSTTATDEATVGDGDAVMESATEQATDEKKEAKDEKAATDEEKEARSTKRKGKPLA